MHRKGVLYDVGRVMGGNWRPDYAPALVQRELVIIQRDLHCTAVKICGRDIGRLTAAAETALPLGLEVWLSPELWNQSPDKTLVHVAHAAAAAEQLRERWPDQLVFSVGTEQTLFMRGIVEGKTFNQRTRTSALREAITAGLHNKPLNAFLARANVAVRQVFRGPVTYASLPWEQVDWSGFDVVGVDHYWNERVKDRYLDMLRPLFAVGKPVVITECGFRTFTGAEKTGLLGSENLDYASLFLHALPLVGRFVRPRVKMVRDRSEPLQAHALVNQLALLESVGVDGAFVFQFIAPLKPYDDDPRHDLDADSFSLVKSFAGGRHGTRYPDVTWEPKEAFDAVAAYYAKH